MALTDFWEIKDNQVLDDKPLLNIYHVKRILAGADAREVAEAFAFSILTLSYRGMQATNLARTTVEVRNLGDVTDFHSFDSSALGGTDVGSYLPGFNASAIQFNRTRVDIRNAQKRFFAGGEADITDGIWSAAHIANLQLLADAMLDTWKTAAAPLVDVCSYAVLKRFCIVPLQDPCLAYRLPNTDVEVDGNHYVPLTATIRANARSQVSRKIL